ncbi:metal-sensing transcriptional repressor [Actibacterium sp. MT2.3-13A]|uniref:metal-sensing transcriptional repressor n=1 Tax=Actibacterium sp. MT2.3-13A TaxID=2828332 RepID=UPI001BA8729F|nr:metal-sensing transcriptional repressor [Actibacterium sp. MT2.3-13A]
MTEPHLHAARPELVRRLKRADGHLRHVIEMIEGGKPCASIAVHPQAVERAAAAAKRTLIHDHIDHCLGRGGEDDRAAPRAMAKLL